MILFSSVPWAQLYTGTVTGTVTDPSGAVVPGTRLQVVQEYASLKAQRGEAGDARAEARAYDALHKTLSLDNSLARAHLLLGKLELKNNRLEQAVSERRWG